MNCRFAIASLVLAAVAGAGLSACGGGGGGDGGGDGGGPPATVVVSGTVTFDRPSYSASNTLDFTSLQRLPVRGATVEVLRASDQSVLATTTTNTSTGTYTATVTNTPIIVRVKAQLIGSGTGAYDFEVRNNTSGNALYTLDSTTVTPSGSSVQVDLNAATGWGGSAYTGTRAAAPFAILYMIWEARRLLQEAEAGLTLPALDIYWSPQNNVTECEGRPNPSTGAIGTTFFTLGLSQSGSCPATPAGIYVLGDADGTSNDDADEFDSSVVAHEFGHFYEAVLSRGDSPGGSHSLDWRLDLTLAFSEGFCNAFQGFVLNDRRYRDTFGTSGSLAFAYDMENGSSPYLVEQGWFAEASVHEFLWDVFDGTGDDQISLGFAAIHTVMRSDMPTTDALTSVYVMTSALETRNPSQQAAIRSALQLEDILGQGAFGANEKPVGANNATGWPADPWAVPVYVPVTFGVPRTVVSINRFAESGDSFYQSYNRLGGRRYLRIDLPAGGGLRITAQGPAGSDPDFALFRRGADQCPSGGGCSGFDDSVGSGLEEATFTGLGAGTYVLEVAECSNLGEICRPGPARGDTAIDVTVVQQ